MQTSMNIGAPQVRGLSFAQPWATLAALGAKRTDTRSWGTRYRGPLLIHAGGKTDRGFLNSPEVRGLLGDLEPPNGAVVAVCRLADCLHTEQMDPSPRERLLGDFSPGRFGWVLEEVRALETPIPARGHLGLWRPPVELLEAVELQLPGAWRG